MKVSILLFCVGAIAFVPTHSFAQTGASKHPDLNGFWNNQYTPNLSQALGHELPYTPYGLQRWKGVDTKDDPTGRCLPVGPSRAFTAPMPFQLVQGPNVIAFLYEYQTIYRMVYMDGRPHPDDILEYPEFMGHSTGRWEGDTLVIDTVGINERSWLDTAGHEHSAKLHLIERLQESPEIRIVDGIQPGARRIQVHVIRQIKRLDSELHALPFPNFEIPRQAHINLNEARAKNRVCTEW